MFENLKNMTDDEVINVINNIVTDNMDVALADLKLILAEASGRKLEKKYINIMLENNILSPQIKRNLLWKISIDCRKLFQFLFLLLRLQP